MMRSWPRRLILALCAVAWASGPGQATQITPSGGPKVIMLAYRADPARRPGFRAYLLREGIDRLRRLKREGVLESCEILFNPFVQPGTWDAMTVMNFSSFAATARWQKIERGEPGGLDAAGLKLARPTATYSADLEWDGAAQAPGAAADHVFYVIPYSYKDADTYRSYVNGYVVPQAEGWIREGVVSRYRIFMNRYPVGDPWDSLSILEYRDLEAFGRRDEALAKVREPLRADPAWKQLNDTKSSIRSESENTIADLLASC